MSSWPEGISPDEVQQLVEESYEDFWGWLINEAEKTAKHYAYAHFGDKRIHEWLKEKRLEWKNTPPALRHYQGCEKTPTKEEKRR